MKISPINNLNSYKNSIQFASVPKYIYPEPKSELPKIPVKFLKAQVKINKAQYAYNPVASVKPNYKLVGHYDDLDKFSELFAFKINSQLLVPTEKDIQNLIDRIKKSTGADEKLIRETVYNLSYYCNYNFLTVFDELIQENNIASFGLPYGFKDNDTYDFSSNAAINYLIGNKHFSEFPNNNDYTIPEKTCYILDNSSLSQLEHYKNSTNKNERAIFDKFFENVHKYIFTLLKGWEIKTQNNGYKGANAFSGTGYLENLAIEVITRQQRGENQNSIYSSDYLERLKNLIGDDDFFSKNIVTKTFEPDIKPEYLTNKGLLKLISPTSISKDYIKDVLKTYLDTKKTIMGPEITQEALLKYLDEMTIAYSIDSLAFALKKTGKNIESALRKQGFSKSDTAYIIPKKDKSYSLITLMYSKLNDINTKNINSVYDITDENTKKAKVILDDISASGTSEGQNCLDIRMNCKNGDLPVIYAPVVLCSQAEDYGARPTTACPNEYFFDKYTSNMSDAVRFFSALKGLPASESANSIKEELAECINKNYKSLNYRDCEILEKILFFGYGAGGLSVGFPYMIPDNCSDISGLILRSNLSVRNTSTNKALGFLFNRKNMAKTNYSQIKKIINKLSDIYPDIPKID